MIQSLMALARRERVVVIGAAILLLLAGLYSFTQLDIEAYTDPVQPMTEILTLPSGYSAEEVEQLVTIPTEYAMSGMLRLESMEWILCMDSPTSSYISTGKATPNSTAPKPSINCNSSRYRRESCRDFRRRIRSAIPWPAPQFPTDHK